MKTPNLGWNRRRIIPTGSGNKSYGFPSDKLRHTETVKPEYRVHESKDSNYVVARLPVQIYDIPYGHMFVVVCGSTKA